MNKKEPGKCHVDIGPFCRTKNLTDVSLEYVKAYIAYMELNNPTVRIDNECVKTALYPEYVEARKRVPYPTNDESRKFNLYLFLGIAIGSLAVIFVLLLVIYIKRKGINESKEIEEAMQT